MHRYDRVRLTPYKRNKKAASQGWKCGRVGCDKFLPASFAIDHIIPLREGGDNSWANLAAVCPDCHSDKSVGETERYYDKLREQRTSVSKYFTPGSTFFLNQPTTPTPPFIAKRKLLLRQMAKGAT
jgi:hypothetical protein